jgi:hypothetical protein
MSLEVAKQHTVIAGNRTVATAAYFIRPGVFSGFAIPARPTRNLSASARQAEPENV